MFINIHGFQQNIIIIEVVILQKFAKEDFIARQSIE